MASLVKRPNAWYVVYQDFQGKQKWVKAFTDKRKSQELANALEDEKTKMKRGDVDPRHEQRKIERAKPIDAHIDEYGDALRAKGNGTNHVSYTLADIRLFVAFNGVDHAEAITRAMMDRWVLKLTEADVDSHSTINRRVGSVKAFLKHLHSVGTLTEYVMFKYTKLKTKGHERRKRRALDAAEQTKLIAKAPAERADLYRFVLGTGARHSACVALTVEDIDLKQRTISIKVKDNQHRNKSHVIPMHDALVPIFQRLTKGKGWRDPIFPEMPPTRTAAKLLRDDCKAAGVDVHEVDFHGLRHSFITGLAKANIHPNVVQALAGHSKVETTLAYYTHFKRTDERAALAVVML